MNRRRFMQTGGLGAMTLYCGVYKFFAGHPATSEDTFVPQSPDFQIHDNGSFDIIFQDLTLKKLLSRV
jgi:DNA polymerase sigma